LFSGERKNTKLTVCIPSKVKKAEGAQNKPYGLGQGTGGRKREFCVQGANGIRRGTHQQKEEIVMSRLGHEESEGLHGTKGQRHIINNPEEIRNKLKGLT